MEKQKKPVAGVKYDGEKPDLSLLPPEPILEVGKVMTVGARKYAPDNWKKVVPRRRYVSAALRHVFAYMAGEKLDPETGLHHLAHATCCMLFVIWGDLKGLQDDEVEGAKADEQGDHLPGMGLTQPDPDLIKSIRAMIGAGMHEHVIETLRKTGDDLSIRALEEVSYMNRNFKNTSHQLEAEVQRLMHQKVMSGYVSDEDRRVAEEREAKSKVVLDEFNKVFGTSHEMPENRKQEKRKNYPVTKLPGMW